MRERAGIWSKKRKFWGKNPKSGGEIWSKKKKFRKKDPKRSKKEEGFEAKRRSSKEKGPKDR